MLSVIIPVYNVSHYICACIDSLRAQTMSDFEVLLIDDHGQDDSMTVAKAYTAGDKRFRYLATPKNSGPGVARNVGIDAARGEYIAFMDSDDEIAPTFLEKLYEAVNADQLTLAYCQLAYRGGARDGQVFRNPVLPSGTFSAADRQKFLRRFVTFSVCFLFRRDFLLSNNLRFPARRNSEDTNFLTRCLLLATSIACVDEPLYIYCIRESSLTTGRNPKRYKERLEAMNALMRDFRLLKQNPRYEALHLQQYNLTMAIIWLKKGLAQCILEIIKKSDK